MPVRRKYKKRRRRRRFKQSKSSALSMLQKYGPMIFRGAKRALTVLNAELKHSIASVASQTADNSGAVITPISIAQGDDVGERSGNSILVKYISFKLRCQAHVDATATDLRVILVQDKESLSSPSVTQILYEANPLSQLPQIVTGKHTTRS